MAKSTATGYTDFYKKTSKTPGASNSDMADASTPVDDEEETDPRKIAIKRRLKLAKKSRR
jgi:hypothetical protein